MTERMSDARFSQIGAKCLPIGVDRLALELFVALDAERWWVGELREQITVMRELLTRYRNEVPLGHQPHLIAHKVDKVLELTNDT